MGIRGLTTFINKYSEAYSETTYLRSTRIIVDGNNLMYHLNTGLPNAHLVCGDYLEFSRRTRAFFQKLHDSDIKAIVVFDGATEDVKWTTVLDRYRKSLKENVHTKAPGNSYLPVNIAVVFREILVEQRILHYQTEFEADDTIAFLAKKLSCPILSSDSDFFVYPDLVSVPLKTIEFRRVRTGGSRHFALVSTAVSPSRLFREEFHFRTTRLIPLACLVLGNDRLPPATFGNFHKAKTENKYDRITFLFKWFGKRAYEDALDKMMGSVREAERERVGAVLQTALLNYSGEGGSPWVWDLVQRDLGLPNRSTSIDLEFLTPVPPWYAEGHTNSSLPTYLIQILVNRIVSLPPQVEIKHFPSTHDLGLRILRVTAGILLGPAEITLLTRERAQVVKKTIDTLTQLPHFGQISTIAEPTFRNRAQALIYEVFELSRDQIEFIREVPSPVKFVVISLFYFIRKLKRASATRISVGVLLSFLRPILGSNDKDTSGSGSKQVNLMKSLKLSPKVNEFFRTWDKIQRFTKTNPYEIRTAYDYAQYQCILSHGLMLSKLLGNPFRIPKLQLLNSHVVYNLVHGSEGGKEAGLLEASFGNEPMAAVLSRFMGLAKNGPGPAGDNVNLDTDLSEPSSTSHSESESEPEPEPDETGLEIEEELAKLNL